MSRYVTGTLSTWPFREEGYSELEKHVLALWADFCACLCACDCLGISTFWRHVANIQAWLL